MAVAGFEPENISQAARKSSFALIVLTLDSDKKGPYEKAIQKVKVIAKITRPEDKDGKLEYCVDTSEK